MLLNVKLDSQDPFVVALLAVGSHRLLLFDKYFEEGQPVLDNYCGICAFSSICPGQHRFSCLLLSRFCRAAPALSHVTKFKVKCPPGPEGCTTYFASTAANSFTFSAP